MSRYGISVYRGYSEGSPPTLYGPDVAYDYSANFSATPINYAAIQLRWSTPKGQWKAFKILRNTYGYPVDSDDGVIVFQNYNGSSSPFPDVNVAEGQEYYYSIFVQGLDNVWHRAASAIGLSVKNFNTANILWNYLPLAVKSLTRNILDTNPENEDLRAFLNLVAFEYDLEKTLIYRLGDATKAPTTPRLLLPALLGELNLEYEPLIGDTRLRTLANRAISLYQAKGSFDGVIAYVRAFTGYNNTIEIGKNLFLDYNQSSFQESTGGWEVTELEVTGYGMGTYGDGGYGGYSPPTISWEADPYLPLPNAIRDQGSLKVTPIANRNFYLSPGPRSEITKRGIPVRRTPNANLSDVYTEGSDTFLEITLPNASLYVSVGQNYAPYADHPTANIYYDAVVTAVEGDTVTLRFLYVDPDYLPNVPIDNPTIEIVMYISYIFSFYSTVNFWTTSFYNYNYRIRYTAADVYGNIVNSYQLFTFPVTETITVDGTTWYRNYAQYYPEPNHAFVYPEISYSHQYGTIPLTDVYYDNFQFEELSLENNPSNDWSTWMNLRPTSFEDARLVKIKMEPNRWNYIQNPNFNGTTGWNVEGSVNTPTIDTVDAANPGNVHVALSGVALEIYSNATSSSEHTYLEASLPYEIPASSTNYTFSGYLNIAMYADPAAGPISLIKPYISCLDADGFFLGNIYGTNDGGNLPFANFDGGSDIYIVTDTSENLKNPINNCFSGINYVIKALLIEVDTLKFKFFEGRGVDFKYNDLAYASANLYYSYKDSGDWGTEILKVGTIGVETDTYKFKIGNGVDTWNDLEYTTSIPAWVRFSMTFDTAHLKADVTGFTSDAASFEVGIDWQDKETNFGNALLVDQAMLEKSAGVGSYFDGSVGQEDTSSIGWLGSADLSSSFYYKNRYVVNDRLQETIYNYITAGTTVKLKYIDS